eukprot:gene19807-26489_t
MRAQAMYITKAELRGTVHNYSSAGGGQLVILVRTGSIHRPTLHPQTQFPDAPVTVSPFLRPSAPLLATSNPYASRVSYDVEVRNQRSARVIAG